MKLAGGMPLTFPREIIGGLARSFVPKPKPARHGCPAAALALGMDRVLGPRGLCGRLAQNLRSLLASGFGGLLRGCEMLPFGSKPWSPAFFPTRADVLVYPQSNNRGVRIHQAKRTAWAEIGPVKNATVTLVAGSAILDPAAELDTLLSIDPVPAALTASTPMWRNPLSGAAFTTRQLRALVKAIMAAAGLDPRHFGAHSLRSISILNVRHSECPERAQVCRCPCLTEQGTESPGQGFPGAARTQPLILIG